MAGFGLAYFVQRYLDLPDKLRRPIAARAIMSVPKNDKYKDYVRYAAHCLNIINQRIRNCVPFNATWSLIG